jgi:hypothetical protein
MFITLDLSLEIGNSDDLTFPIVNFLFFGRYILEAMYGIYISRNNILFILVLS